MDVVKELGYLLWREKTIISGFVVAGVLAVAAQLNIVIDAATVQTYVAPVVAGLIARFFTVPANEVEEVHKPQLVKPIHQPQPQKHHK